MNQPFRGSVESIIAVKPDAIAFIEGDASITWREWNARADRLAHALMAVGVEAGTRIATRLATRHEWFVVQLAASKIGASIVGVNNRSTVEETQYLIEDSGAQALVLDDPEPDAIVALARAKGIEAIVSLARATDPQVLLYQDAIAVASVEPLISTAPAALILYTSGTTGRPKGVAFDPAILAKRKDVQAYRDHMASMVPLDETSRFLLCLPMHHGAGPNSALFCLRCGGSVVIQRKFDPEEALRLLAQFKVTNWMAVPTMIHRLATLPAEISNRYGRASIRAVNIGAAAVPLSLKRWAKQFFGPQALIFEGYGMTETQMISYLLPPDWDLAPDSSGKPMPYVDVKILRPDGAAAGVNETGEICVRTPMMIDRYLNRPPLGVDDLTPDGHFRTGDVGRIDENGYLYVTDRLKDMVIVGGANVYPAEVEAALDTHPDVGEAAVIGIPHSDLGEQVFAICEMRPGAKHDAQALITHCRKTLASYKVPKSVQFVDELPRNPTGKVLKTVLREPYWVGHERKV